MKVVSPEPALNLPKGSRPCGVRVFADYLPPRISLSSKYARILELERKLGRRPQYAAVARYTHCLARCMESGA